MKKIVKFSLFPVLFLFVLLSCSEKTPKEEPVQLAAPEIEVVSVGKREISFKWESVENADSYEYVFKLDSKEIVRKTVLAPEVVECSDLTPNTAYTVHVRAWSDSDKYMYSEWAVKEVRTVDPSDKAVEIKDEALKKAIMALEPSLDVNGDGVLTGAEAAALKVLNIGFETSDDVVADRVVKDLSGLEDFVSLEEVNFKYHQISDPSPLYLIEGLKLVNLGENPVESFDVSRFPVLEDLRLYGSKVSEIATDKLASLKSLYLQRTQITEIDLTPMKNLTECYLNEAKLVKLTVDGIPGLTRLDAVKNQLEEVSVTNCDALFQLHLNTNKLKNVTLENLPKLAILNLYENEITLLDLTSLPSIINLFVYSNKLESLNLSALSSLVRLYVSNNPLKELVCSASPQLEELEVSSMPELELINLKNGGFSDWAYYDMGYECPKLKKVIVDAGAEETYVKGIFKNNPDVQVVTE